MVSKRVVFGAFFILSLVYFSIFWGRFNKTIIPFALVGYEIEYSQLGPTGLLGYLPSHIQCVLMEWLLNIRYEYSKCASRIFCALNTLGFYCVTITYLNLEYSRIFWLSRSEITKRKKGGGSQIAQGSYKASVKRKRSKRCVKKRKLSQFESA